MGHRLSRITTRTGDDGSTGLGNGERVLKSAARVVALGEIDELNSHLGVLLAEPLPGDVFALLKRLQNVLFDLGGELSIPGSTLLKSEAVELLDSEILHYNKDLPPLQEFILPGGSRAAALAHVARTVARRAERSVVFLGQTEPVSTHARLFLNRLSDLLFILARVLNRHAGTADQCWQRTNDPGKV